MCKSSGAWASTALAPPHMQRLLPKAGSTPDNTCVCTVYGDASGSPGSSHLPSLPGHLGLCSLAASLAWDPSSLPWDPKTNAGLKDSPHSLTFKGPAALSSRCCRDSGPGDSRTGERPQPVQNMPCLPSHFLRAPQGRSHLKAGLS